MYPWLKDNQVDFGVIKGRMQTLAKLGVPYTEEDFLNAERDGLSQGQLIADDLASQSVELSPDSEMAALIAYMQRLGRGPQPIAATPAAAGGN
jgi:cytochrome c oxidase cbb3-type subunit I/II